MHIPLIFRSTKSFFRPSSTTPFKVPYILTRTMASETSKLNISSNSNSDDVQKALEPLISRWQISATNSGIEREFNFKTFKTTWAFMNKVAEAAQKNKHHPEWSNVYNTTFIRWTTHHPPGLSTLDLQLAKICDELAADMGEVAPALVQRLPPGTAKEQMLATGNISEAMEKFDGEQMCSLTDRVVKVAGDCCVPNSARKSVPRMAEENEGDTKVEGAEL